MDYLPVWATWFGGEEPPLFGCGSGGDFLAVQMPRSVLRAVLRWPVVPWATLPTSRPPRPPSGGVDYTPGVAVCVAIAEHCWGGLRGYAHRL